MTYTFAPIAPGVTVGTATANAFNAMNAELGNRLTISDDGGGRTAAQQQWEHDHNSGASVGNSNHEYTNGATAIDVWNWSLIPERLLIKYGFVRDVSGEWWHIHFIGTTLPSGGGGGGLYMAKGWNWIGIQQMLKALYGYAGPIDGIPGIGTWAAMQRFLAANWGYTAGIDSLPGNGTWAAIAKWLRARYGYVGNDVPGPIMGAAFARANAANDVAY